MNHNLPISPYLHIHNLRHMASTLWQSLGVSEKMVQEMLGHSKIEIKAVIVRVACRAMIHMGDIGAIRDDASLPYRFNSCWNGLE